MNRAGRPIRFLAMALSGWVGVRVAILWPTTGSLPAAIERALPFGVPIPHYVTNGELAVRLPPPAIGRPSIALAVAAPTRDFPTSDHRFVIAKPPGDARAAVDDRRLQFALLGLVGFGALESTAQVSPPIAPLPDFSIPPPRISGSAWIVARAGEDGSAPAAGGPGQLGGSQAGVRLVRPIGQGDRLAVAGRLTTPLAAPGKEAALGVEWRVPGAPVAVVAERRFAIDGAGTGGPAVGAIAGVDRAIGAGFALEAYGQTGAVARERLEPYADGALRVVRPAGTVGRTGVAVGVGGWGGAQRGATRLDIGPSAVASMPVGKSRIRMSLDWRQRVAGEARPGSGLTLGLGTDF